MPSDDYSTGNRVISDADLQDDNVPFDRTRMVAIGPDESLEPGRCVIVGGSPAAAPDCADNAHPAHQGHHAISGSTTAIDFVEPSVSPETMLRAPSLTSVQLAFLTTLLPGPRPTDDCQDAITVGSLMRLNLVAWDEPDHRVPGGYCHDTFALTQAGIHALTRQPPHR